MGDDRRDLTSGDPLGGAPAPAPAPAHYGEGRVPPGAFAPKPGRPPLPAKHELAEWWRRALATVIDALIVGGITLVVLVALGVGIFGDGDGGALAVAAAIAVGIALFAGLALGYAPLLMARTNGQTLGKMATGCRVVRTDGKRVDFWWAALREVAVKGLLVGTAAAITGGIAYLVDVLWPLFDDPPRALHDFAVNSRVTKT